MKTKRTRNSKSSYRILLECPSLSINDMAVEQVASTKSLDVYLIGNQCHICVIRTNFLSFAHFFTRPRKNAWVVVPIVNTKSQIMTSEMMTSQISLISVFLLLLLLLFQAKRCAV